MAENTKAPRDATSREAQVVASLAGERSSSTPLTPVAQALTDRRAATAHQHAAVASAGAHRAGELALARFYDRRAAAALWRAAA